MYFSQLSHDAIVIFLQYTDEETEHLASFIFSGSYTWEVAKQEFKPRQSGSVLLSKVQS